MKFTLTDAMATLDSHGRAFPAPCHESTFAQIFQHGTMEIEIYRPEGVDLQTPHDQDELYFIASGSGQFEHEASTHEVETGDVLFVAAGERHRFVNFSPDFSTWVVLYGPTGGE